jgi:cystatin-A/B
MALAGGWNDQSELSQEQWELVVSLKEAVEAHLGQEFEHFVPVKIRQQVVAGMNYWVKVQHEESSYVHVKIFKPLPHTGAPAEVKEVHAGMTLEDEL